MPVLAIGGVGLVIFVIALAALLMLMAGHVIHGITKGIFGFIPGVGQYISGGISAFLGAATKAAAPVYNNLVHPVAHWLWAYAMGPWHLAWNMVQSIADAKSWGVNAQQQAMDAKNQAIIDAAAAQANAIAHADANLGIAEQYADTNLAQAENFANSVGANAIGIANGLYNSAIVHADSNLTTAEQYANGVLTQANDFTVQQADDVRSEAVRLFGQAEAGIRTLEGEVAAIPAEIAGAIDNVVPGDIAKALAGAGVASIPFLLSQVGTITTEVDTCLKPLCDTVTPNAGRLGNLGNLFANMELLGVEALLIALASECLTNPGAVANDVSSTVHTVGDAVITGFRDLIGA